MPLTTSQLNAQAILGQGISAPAVEALKQLNLNAAGLDIGASEIYVCVPEDRDSEKVRVFGTFTRDLEGIADWLSQCQVTSVAMESTGIYWLGIYQILEARGVEVLLVNAAHIKNVTGKKTDILDCQWIQQLHTYGLLAGSFRPVEQVCVLRSLVRHREMLIRSRVNHIQHMQKALEQMNLKLTQVVSDITGATGLGIIRAIIGGTHDPEALAQYRHIRCQTPVAQIIAALSGDYRQEHLFTLKQAVALYDFYTEKITETDTEIQAQFERMTASDPVHPLAKRLRTQSRGKNEPGFDLRLELYRIWGVDLTAVPGLNVLTLQVLLSEIGTDMSKWPTVKNFTSWLGLSPHNDKTGGRVIRSRTRKVASRANQALRMAARALCNSHSSLGVFYRKMRERLGAGKAVAAAAHKLARIIYHLLKHRVEYQPISAEQMQAHLQQKQLRHLQAQAQKVGARLVFDSDDSLEVQLAG